MNQTDRDNATFINSFIKCRERDGASLTVHLARPDNTPRRAFIGVTLCRPGKGRNLLVVARDEAGPFDPRLDLPNVCPDCAAAYERIVRKRAGLPAEGRLVFGGQP